MNYTQTPKPPYYVVIFSFELTGVDLDEYAAEASRLMGLAKKIDGFYGEDAAKMEDGMCITTSFWRDEEAITEWRKDAEHTATRKVGRDKWYNGFDLRVAKVERDYSFTKSN